ncbi:hypothetical protein [Bordetella sp. 15P40C-2]|uniref:hypothetical protein n=1 Tax=Bordetella sp. 15P40C-2 TaxID=2572246 RepID=UPI00132460A9|nr:hypothetical protein [Bordetella sp. 15P40C-2]MVW72125.1 hypothetical protein [Bordetella sp. 15P40C-2]
MAEPISKQKLVYADADADTLSNFANGEAGVPNINRAGDDVKNLATIRQEALAAAADAANLQTYLSYDSPSTKRMVDDESQPVGIQGDVTNDSDPAKNGRYTWGGSGWTKNPVQPASGETVVALQSDVGEINGNLGKAATLVSADSPDHYPIAAYRHALAVGVHKTTGELYAKFPTNDPGIKQNVDNRLAAPMWSMVQVETDPRYGVMALSANGKSVFHLDFQKGVAVAFGKELGSGSDLSRFPLVAGTQMLMMILYGQSLETGAQGQPPLSTAQPYSNLTFGAGPKATKAGSLGSNPGTSTSKLLVEDELNGDQGEGGNRGETSCSGAANYASVIFRRYGIDPADLPFFASTAAHGGYTIDQLGVGSSWLQVWRDHVTEQAARIRELGKVPIMPALIWGQGQANQSGAVTPEIYAEKLEALRQYQVDFVKNVTGHEWEPPMLLFPPTANAMGYSTLAQLWLARTRPDKYRIITPDYFLPRAADGTHLINIGYKWRSAYLGRVEADITLNRKWKDYVMPGLPVRVNATTVRVSCFSGYPLQLTGDTPSYGFAVTINGALVPSESLTVTLVGQDVILTHPTAGPEDIVIVRYAMNYKAPGVTLNGYMGGLCDTSPDVVEIEGQVYNLWNYCPAFMETARYETI